MPNKRVLFFSKTEDALPDALGLCSIFFRFYCSSVRKKAHPTTAKFAFIRGGHVLVLCITMFIFVGSPFPYVTKTPFDIPLQIRFSSVALNICGSSDLVKN